MRQLSSRLNALWLCTMLVLIAAAGAGAREPAHSLRIGGDTDADGGYSLRAGVDLALSEVDVLFVDAGTAQTDRDLSTRFVDAGLEHEFDAVRLGFSGGWWEDTDVVATTDWRVSLGFGGDRLAVDLKAQLRHSDYQAIPFQFQLTIGDNSFAISGSADCELDGRGLGATLRTSAADWLGYLGGTVYDYGATDCDIDSPQLAALAQLDRERLRTLGAGLAQSLSRTASVWTNRQSLFLDHEFVAGLGFQGRRLFYGLDYQYGQEAFVGDRVQSIAATLSVPLADADLLDLYLGVARYENSADTGFAGVLLVHRF